MISRKVLLVALGVLLLAAGFFGRQFLRPPLTDEQAITAKLEDMALAAKAKTAGRLTAPMSDNFRWQSLSKREIDTQLRGFFFSARNIDAQISNLKVVVKGETATVDGQYRVEFRSSPDAPLETKSGRFQTRWIKRDGDWKLEAAEGGENLTP